MGALSVSLPSDGETADASDYNTPITTIVNEINGGLDNSNIAANAAIDGSKLANGSVDTDTLAESAVTTDKIDDGAVVPNKLALGVASATVDTSQTTTSTSYADLSTTTDQVTVTIGANGLALVGISSRMANNTTNGFCFVSFEVSGANSISASNSNAIMFQNSGGGVGATIGKTVLLTGLNPGSTTFKMKYVVQTGGGGSGTGTFANRTIFVIPL